MFSLFWGLVGAGAGASLIYGLIALALMFYNPNLYHSIISTIWFIVIGGTLFFEALANLMDHHANKKKKDKNEWHKI